MKVIIIISIIFKIISTDTIFTKNGLSWNIENNERVVCGNYTIKQDECENKWCCWDEIQNNINNISYVFLVQ